MTDIGTVLVLGLGSMGKRRIRNLQRLGVAHVIGFDPRDDRRREAADTYGIATVGDATEGFASDPDAVIISTPPDLHVRYAREAVRLRRPFFMEASVVNEGMRDLAADVRRVGVLAAPSCTMRFHPSIRQMKHLVETGRIGRVLAYTYHSGQYLPDWHPWEDYRRFYASRRETGACREIVPFELIWLRWIVGPIARVAAMKGKVSDLDVDIDDVYQVLLAHESGSLGHMLIDVVARAAIRRCVIMGALGTLTWDWGQKRVSLYEASAGVGIDFSEGVGTVQPGYVHAEEPYVDEMRTFFEAVSGRTTWPHTIEDDIRTLDLLSAAERSAREGHVMEVVG